MTAWQIPYVNLGAQFAAEKDELMRRIEAVLASGMHIGGAEVDALEAELATYVGTRHAVALNSGTDALIFAVIAAGVEPGQEVITPPNREQLQGVITRTTRLPSRGNIDVTYSVV